MRIFVLAQGEVIRRVFLRKAKVSGIVPLLSKLFVVNFIAGLSGN
jgi:hypothetical protein